MASLSRVWRCAAICRMAGGLRAKQRVGRPFPASGSAVLGNPCLLHGAFEPSVGSNQRRWRRYSLCPRATIRDAHQKRPFCRRCPAQRRWRVYARRGSCWREPTARLPRTSQCMAGKCSAVATQSTMNVCQQVRFAARLRQRCHGSVQERKPQEQNIRTMLFSVLIGKEMNRFLLKNRISGQ